MKATKDSWSTSPMPERRAKLSLERHYSREEYDHLSEGEIPESQDDEVGEASDVHVHRSWTGLEIYEVRLSLTADGYQVTEAWVNDDPDQYQRDPVMDDALLGPMLDRLAGRSAF